jgi:beta-lactamase regulating signal transducer with metallopeptidase domain
MDVIANWLLQGTAVAAATTALLHVWPRLSATTRYRVWWITLAVLLAMPVLRSLPTGGIAPSAGTAMGTSARRVEMPVLPRWPIVLALVTYTAWTTWSCARIGRALLHLRTAKRRCRELSVRRQQRLRRWSALRDQGRRARLVVSNDVGSVSVLGLTSPAIAVSPALLRALEDEELDCILVHEWAHVQRRDDLARLLQVIVRAVAGLHPAIWWIDRQLHIDRETACDDWAIQLTGSARRYAACLTKVAALNIIRAPEAMILPAALSPSDLTRRVRRLLDPRRSASTKRPLTATALALPLVTVFAIIVASIQVIVPAAPPVGIAVGRSSVALPPLLTPIVDNRRVAPLADGRRASPRQPRTKAAPPATTVPIVTTTHAIDAVLSPTPAETSQQMSAQTFGELRLPAVLPGVAGPVGELNAATTVPAPPDAKDTRPWDVAADAGVTIGKKSQAAAVVTAGFFSRLGKSVARSF